MALPGREVSGDALAGDLGELVVDRLSEPALVTRTEPLADSPLLSYRERRRQV
jgi:hypothetical protein